MTVLQCLGCTFLGARITMGWICYLGWGGGVNLRYVFDVGTRPRYQFGRRDQRALLDQVLLVLNKFQDP